MHKNTFISALDATARIACCATLVGLISCQDKSEQTEPSSDTQDTNTQDTNDSGDVVDPLDSDDDGDGVSENQGDCDDTNADISPNATEVCNEIDDNCDDLIDNDASDATLWYVDADYDGYGAGEGTLHCGDPPTDQSYSQLDGDCDDTNYELSPADNDGDGASTCDGDCNDDNATLTPFDGDGDGYSTCDGDCNDDEINIVECSLEECNDLIEDTFTATTPDPDDSTLVCCQMVADDYDQHLQDLEQWTYRYECCDLLDWQGSMACTPWGPPTPPTMHKNNIS